MKRILIFCILLSISLKSLADERLISGTISSSGSPLENASIQIINKGVTAFSNKEGKYRILAQEGDILFYSAAGMESVNIKVEDVTRVLNVEMFPHIEKLENVTVTSKKYFRTQKELKEAHWRDPDVIQTAFGFLDRKRVAYSIRVMEGTKILPGEYDLGNVLNRRFAGIRASPGLGAGFERTVTARQGRVIFDIDGQIFTDFPDFIDVQNIKRIALISSLSGVTRYGSLGRGGVVVINTNTGTFIPKDEKGLVVDQARIRNNFIKEPALLSSQNKGSIPTYLLDWSSSNSFERAKVKFERNKEKYANSPYFFLDAYRHFYDTWNQTEYADAIIEANYYKLYDNPVLLKALAYIYDSQGRYKRANETYQEVFILRPHYAQSYLDLARSNRNIKNNRRATILLTRYFHLVNEGFLQVDSTMFASIINREYENMVYHEKNSSKTESGGINNDQGDFKGTRLVFEWNDSEAEFDLQFVNPNNQYYTWKHSLKENAKMIQQEKYLGYSCSEHLIDDFFTGIWKVNVNYLGNKSLTPTYLKATIYHDYGTPSQTKKVRVFKLNMKNVNQELFRINKL